MTLATSEQRHVWAADESEGDSPSIPCERERALMCAGRDDDFPREEEVERHVDPDRE